MKKTKIMALLLSATLVFSGCGNMNNTTKGGLIGGGGGAAGRCPAVRGPVQQRPDPQRNAAADDRHRTEGRRADR